MDALQFDWFYYSAEWVPALFILLFVILLEQTPLNFNKRILDKICKDASKDSCIAILRQKALLEFGMLSLVMAMAREAVVGHMFMIGFGVIGIIVFALVAYLWLTIIIGRQFGWVTRPASSAVYVFLLVAMSTTISSYGQEIETGVITFTMYLSLNPPFFFFGLAMSMFVLIFYLQMRKGARDASLRLPKESTEAEDSNEIKGRDAAVQTTKSATSTSDPMKP